MNKPSRIVSWGLALLVALLTTGVVYAEQEVYFDAAYGRAQLDDDSLGIAVADDTDAWRLGAGFDFGNHIAVEVGYLNLGDLEEVADIGWESELSTPSATFRSDGEDLYYGVSLDFDISRNLTFSGEWDRFEFDDGEADVIFAGLRYRF